MRCIKELHKHLKIFIYCTLCFLISGCGSKEMGSIAGLGAFVTLIAIVIVCYWIYFIFKVHQFVIQAVNLYKEAIIKEEKIIGLLLDIRDNTKSTTGLEKSEMLDHRVICICYNCFYENRFSQEVVKGEFFYCIKCNSKNFIYGDDLSGGKIHGNHRNRNILKEIDYNCVKCDSLITLEGTEIEEGKFICPVCNTENKLK